MPAPHSLKFQEVDIRRVRLVEFKVCHHFISVPWLNSYFGFTPFFVKRFLFALALIVTTVTRPLRADTSVVFNEIMYHPSTNEALFEWIELRNQMAVDVDLSGWSISGGSRYAFPSNTVVRGGGFVLVAAAPSTLSDQIGVGVALFGPFIGTNRLSNNGETLRLRNNHGRVVDEITYGTDGDWPVASNGSGASLAKRDPDSASGPSGNWTWSLQTGGTPGTTNFSSIPALGIVFNELSAATQSEFWLELFNAGKDRLSLEGCILVQDGGSHHEYVFSATPDLAPGGYRVIATATLGGLAALGCTLLPWLPVKILLPGIPTELSAPLVPWFAWGMLAFTLANVLFSDRMAHGDFRFVPGALVLASAYGVSLWGFQDSLLRGSPAEGLQRVVQRLVLFNAALLVWAVLVSLQSRFRRRGTN